MKVKIFFVLVTVTVLFSLGLRGQTPAMVVVPAQTAAPAAPAPVPARDNSVSWESTLKLLQEMKATNDATLKAQAATLATLDDLQKAAEELKIFSKRG